MNNEALFARVRKLIEPLAVRLGDRKLKEACCELVVDSGDGRHAIKALGKLRGLDYRIGDLEDAKDLLSARLTPMGITQVS